MIRRSLDTYDILVGSVKEGLSSTLSNRSYSKVVVIIDENTEDHCLPLIADVLPEFTSIRISSGERHKTIQTCEYIWSQMIDLQLDRHALVINLGGGVIGDMGGFCARTYKRGIDFLQIPTTLLSQVDASVGGKLGVDFQGIKNIVGLFYDPIAVLIDPAFLSTLTSGELRSGYAEIVKHGMIADVELWNDTKIYRPEHTDWTSIVDRSVAVKQQVVEIDQKEGGLRKILNFGHTIGHAIETYYLDGPKHLLHGEAIAIGMICESYLSHLVSGLPLDDADHIKTRLLTIYGVEDINDLDIDQIFDYMNNDKKNVGGEISFSLLDNLGSCTWDQKCDRDMIEASLAFYKA